MKSDKQIIEEMNNKIKETDYPGSSFNCGVYAIWIDDDFVYFYYPEENSLMRTNRKTHEDELLGRNFYKEKAALNFIKKNKTLQK